MGILFIPISRVCTIDLASKQHSRGNEYIDDSCESDNDCHDCDPFCESKHRVRRLLLVSSVEFIQLVSGAYYGFLRKSVVFLDHFIVSQRLQL